MPKSFFRAGLLAALAVLCFVAVARADSCWVHNGSLMRLQAAGAARWISYEAPRRPLWSAGVARGTLLFDGERVGNWYRGIARVFSSACPADPLEYFVEGPVSFAGDRITMRGTRPVYRNCRPTGRRTTDTLIFTYSHRC